MLLYYSKRPDLFMDFYFAITNNILFDKYSDNYKYSKEVILLDKLWELCDEGDNFLYSLLYINIAEYALKTEFDFTEGGKKKITFCSMKIALTDELIIMRRKIWSALFVLRKNELLCNKVNTILLTDNVNNENKDAAKDFIVFDFDTIYPFIEENIDYTAAKIIDFYRNKYLQLKLEVDNRLLRAQENDFFRFYSLLTGNNIKWIISDEDNQIMKEEIWKEIKQYSIDDFDYLFDACNYICASEKAHEWEIDYGISIVFSLLEDVYSKYTKVLESFFSHGAPGLLYSLNKVINFMLKKYGYKHTKNSFVANNSILKTDGYIVCGVLCQKKTLLKMLLGNSMNL